MVGSLGHQGLEGAVMNLYRNIDRKRFQFDFVVCSQSRQRYDDEVEALGGTIHRLPSRSAKPFQYFLALKRLLGANDGYNAFHVHANSAGLFVDCLAAGWAGVPVIIAHSHNSSCIRRLAHVALRPFLPLVVDKQVACSEEAAQHMFGRKHHATLLPNGIDVDRFSFDLPARQRFRSELGISEEVVLGHVGSFGGAKNQEFIIEILHDLRAEGVRAKAVFLGDGNTRSEVAQLAKRKGLDGDVHFLGNRSDVEAALSAFDFFLFPSLFEGFGIALLEAQAAGLKCIASDRVPRVVQVTDDLVFCSIHRGTREWVRFILQNIGYERSSGSEKLSKAVWNIKNTAIVLENIYSDLVAAR